MKIRLLLYGMALAIGIGLGMALSGCSTTNTPSGASDPQGERLAQAYHILAKCDADHTNHNDHITKAMDYTKNAARILGTDIEHDGVQDVVEGDCLQHLQNAREMIRIAHASLPVTGEKKALVNAGAALREVTAAINQEK